MVTRTIDNVKKLRGEAINDFSNLRMRPGGEAAGKNAGKGAAGPPPVPMSIKLK